MFVFFYEFKVLPMFYFCRYRAVYNMSVWRYIGNLWHKGLQEYGVAQDF